MNLYRKYAWFTLTACVGVILWGAYVRATGSGAGCGSHWPLCNGEVLPRTDQEKTFIEFSHRVSSGLLLISVLVLAIWASRLFPRGSFPFRAAWLSFVAVLIEALIGAFLVLLQLVEQDQSTLRVFSISLHLVNTLFLLAALTCATLSPGMPNARWRWPDRSWRPFGLTGGFALLGALGAVAALGDTLFPPTSVFHGIISDFARDSHLAEKIRILHPLAAVAWVGALAWWLAEVWQRDPRLRRLGQALLGLCGFNMLLGMSNIFFLAPVGLQIFHLGVADVLWIVFISLRFFAASRW